MVFWPVGFCSILRDSGFDVVRFDNRDTGLSTRFASSTVVNPWSALLGHGKAAPYSGEDMADDGFAVMDALGWTSAHLVGVSMGSALVQYMAIRRPDRVRSLACISALVRGNALKTLTQLKYGAVARLARMKFPDTTQGQIDRQVAIIRTMTAVEEGFDESWATEVARQAVERGIDDSAQSRHLAALKESGRAADPVRITAPTVIIQGIDDPLIRLDAARNAANSIRGAQFVPLPGLGHGIGANRWPDIVATIRANADRATDPAPA